MRILFIGDVVGKTGRTAISEYLPDMVKDWSLDLVVVNGENSAGGFGITEAIYQDFLDAGADAITLGNHAWNQKEALVFIERAPRLIRPSGFSRALAFRIRARLQVEAEPDNVAKGAGDHVRLSPGRASSRSRIVRHR